LSEIRQRVERYPGDLGIRFELAELLFKLGKFSEAAPEFQKAQANPHKRLQAMSYLGQCFAARGMNDMAARQLQNALKEKPVFRRREEGNDLRAGGCL
jgi:tetratricopeptide (TPR) repeat protein